MPTEVEIPYVGSVEFPDSMSTEDVGAESERLYQQATARAAMDQMDPMVPARSPEELGLKRFYAGGYEGEHDRRTAMEMISTPLVNLVQRFNPQDIADAIDVLGAAGYATSGAPSAEKSALAQEIMAAPSRTPGTTEKVAAALGNVGGKAVNSVTSPLGIATLGQGMLPKTLQRLISGAFAADMARHTPEMAREAGKASVEGDIEKQVETIGDLLMNSAMVLAAGSHAVTPEKVKLSRTLAQQLLDAEIAGRTKFERAAGTEISREGAKGAEGVETSFPKEGDTFGVLGEEAGAGQPAPASFSKAPVPESTATLAAQFDLLKEGKRRAVLITEGALVPELPEGMATHETPAGLFVFDPAKVTAEELTKATAENRVGEVLDYGVSGKPPTAAQTPGAANTVVVRAADGTEIQSVVTDEANRPNVEKAAEAVKPADGTVTIEPAEKVIQERMIAREGATPSGGARAKGSQLPPNDLLILRGAIEKAFDDGRPVNALNAEEAGLKLPEGWEEKVYKSVGDPIRMWEPPVNEVKSERKMVPELPEGARARTLDELPQLFKDRFVYEQKMAAAKKELERAEARMKKELEKRDAMRKEGKDPEKYYKGGFKAASRAQHDARMEVVAIETNLQTINAELSDLARRTGVGLKAGAESRAPKELPKVTEAQWSDAFERVVERGHNLVADDYVTKEIARRVKAGQSPAEAAKAAVGIGGTSFQLADGRGGMWMSSTKGITVSLGAEKRIMSWKEFAQRGPKRAPEQPKAVPGRKARVNRAEAARPWDILDDIEGSVGRKLSLARALEIDPDFKPTGYIKEMFSKVGGIGLDVALRELHDQGTHRRIESESAFLEAIQRASDGRKKWAKEFSGKVKSGEIHAFPESKVTGEEIGQGSAEPRPTSDGAGARRRPPVEDDPEFTAFPVELPEAVRFARDLLGGKYPRVVEGLRLLGGRALGVFRATTGDAKSGRIDLRADIADLLTREEKADLMRQAQEYAERVAEAGDNVENIARERYEFLEREAYEAAKTRPPVLALKVLWHEIGHAVDFLPEAMIQGRGNLFGRIASLKNYLKHTLARDPSKPEGKPLSPKERAELLAEAEALLREEMGPIREIVRTILVDEPIYETRGITAADIVKLLGMEARETMPELYSWFAEQGTHNKKEILKAALKGAVHEMVVKLDRREQVGTKKVHQTVRERVGRDPTREEIQERFRTLFREELQRRNLAELKTVKAELEGAIAWWHGAEKMPDYFKTSAEMYAEAFSIWMNNPAALQKRAPTFSRLLWNHLEAKPEAKRLYDAIQNEVKAGQAADITEKQMLDSWDKADAQSMEEAQSSRVTSFKDTLENVSYHFDRRFGPIYRAAKGYAGEGQLRQAIGNFLYRQSEHELFLGRMNRNVGELLVSKGLDWKDLGRFLFYKRVVGERFKMFNPYGIAPDRALNRLGAMRTSMGEEKFRALERSAEEFRGLYESMVANALRKAGMFTPELQQAIDSNVYYATFDVRQAKPRDGIESLLATSFGDNTTAHIYKQLGTVKEIKNPATATVLKALSLLSASSRNTAKRETVRMLMVQDPGNIMPAKQRWTGKRMEPIMRETDKVGTVVYLRDGKAEAFYVRKVVADALNKGNAIENQIMLRGVQAVGALKGLFTQLNYAFWPVNFVKDTMGWMMQVPGAGPASWAKVFPEAVRASRASVKGRRNAAAEAALARKMVISRSDPRGVWAAADNEFEVKLASYGLNPAQWSTEATKVHAIVKAWNSYREMGQTFERVNKIGAMLHLDEKFPTMPEWKKREIVRERGGSPDFLQRGASNPYIDFFAMFYNPWKESIRSVVKSARENPFSFSAKTTAFIVAPSVLQVLASAGAFGDDLEEKYRSIPDYDLSNYLVIPLGWADEKQKTVAYLRLPLWEPARLVHGGVWQTLTGRGRGLLSFAGGQVPGVNPLVNVAHDWAQFEVFNHNPYDAFRGQNVLDDTTFQAGGWDARKEMLKQSWNALGGSVVHRFPNTQLESPPETEVQKFLGLPVVNNALGRWVKVSNKGLADGDRRVTEGIEQERAQIRLAMQEVVRKLTEGESLVESERVLLREPYAVEYLKRLLPEVMQGRSSQLLRRLNDAQSKASKAAILTNEIQRARE